MPNPESAPPAAAAGPVKAKRPFNPIPTSVTVFIGRAASGPMFSPVLCSDQAAFDSTFGAENPFGDLSRAVRLFFDNAGSRCHVVRVRNRDDPDAEWEASPTANDFRDALDSLSIELPDLNLMVIPRDDAVDPATQHTIWKKASQFCRERRAMLLVDAPLEWAGLVDVNDKWSDLGIARLREGMALESVALFYPRVMVRDGDAEVPTGCCGAMAGLMTSFDEAHGVWTPAAGTDAVIRGIMGLEHETTEEEASLFANEGVDVLRSLPEVGVVSWGARTLAGHTNSWWRFIPIRRLALFIEQSIKHNMEWVVFEASDENLWKEVRASAGMFLFDLWQRGALEGEQPEEAFFVKCDEETNTVEFRDNGMVHFYVGFAPVRPTEFMFLEFTKRCHL